MPNDRLKLAVAEALRIGKIDENETRMLNYEIQ